VGVAVADKCGTRVADISCPIRVIQVYFYFNVSQPSVYFDNLLSDQAGLTRLSSPRASNDNHHPQCRFACALPLEGKRPAIAFTSCSAYEGA
jgi:hypothetical protein